LDATNTRSENELFAYLRNTKLKRERYKTTDPKKWNNEDIYNARTHGKMSLQQVAEQMGLDRTEVRTREQKHMRSLRNLAKQRLIERAVDNELLDTEAPEERRRAVPRKLIDSDLSLRLEMRRKKIRDSEPEIYEEFYRLLAERAGTRVDPEQANKNISEILSILAEKYDTYPSRIRRAVVKHGQSLRQGLELESSDSPDVKPIRSQSRRSQVAQMSPSARRMSAVSRQAADIPGFQSRSRRSRDARGGERAVSELDGQLYKSLSTEEQAKIPEEVAKLREETQRALKEIFRAYWRGQVGGASVEGYVGTRRARQRPEDDKLTTADIVEMTRQLDVAISKGQVLIFELDENNQPKLDKNGNPKEKAGGARDIERLLDDMQTLTAIEEGKNWSLLEQLHPKSREHIVASALGVVRPPTTKRDGTPRKKKQIVTNVDYVKMTPDARKERKFDFSTASTVYKKGGGVDLRALTPKQLEQDATIGRRRVRILRMSDRRYQRRLERGFKRREGRIYIERPESAQQRRALRRRQAVRRMQAQFRRTKSPDDAVRMVEQQRMRLHPIIFNDDDTITVDRVLPETLAGLYDVRFGDATRSTTSAENAFLQSTWESTGFMQQPILLKEREVTELMRAGWQPIIRGVSGQDAVEGEGYVEQFLTNPERFIPGQGGRMYGIGEYFTFPESADDWAGYGRGPRGTILGLLPPTSNIISANDLSTIRSQLHDMVTPVANVVGIAGGRDAMRAKTSEEVLEEFKKALPATIGERTDIGSKIIRGLFDFFEKAVIDERDNKGADTTKLRQQIIDSILLLDNLSKGQVGNHDPALGLLAPLLGFDAHVSGSVLLLHNRGALVANLEPLDKARAVEIGTIDGTRVGQVWRKFKDYVKPSGTRARKPVKDKRRPQKTSAPDDDQSISAKDAGVIDVSSWKPIPGTTAGSNGGQQFDAPDGTRYFVKPTRSDTGGTSRERAENEVLASKLYALFGIDAIDADIGATGGSVRVVSKYRADLSNARGGDERRSIQDGFAVDALLGNWDVVENDNTKMDSGTPVRTDVGGSMRFRAQGSPKGAQWNDVGEEINSMRGKGRNAGLVGPGARSYFGDITPEQIRTQVAKMMQVPEQEIRDTVASVIKDPKRAKEMADILIKRRSNIQALAANLKE
jgi:transcriptional regulator with XRE-family HTH domain